MNAFRVEIHSVTTQQPDAISHTRLVQAAQQFEAVMLGELMKPLGKGSVIGEDTDESSSNPMQSYGVEAMAGALAKSGALGFAAKMVNSVEARAVKNSSAGAQVFPENADVSEREDQP
jgi:Rod binding domain-containing protein